MIKVKNKIGAKHLLMFCFVSFLIIAILSISVLYYMERQVRKTKIEDAKVHEISAVELGSDIMGKEFAAVISDINYLKKAYKEEFVDENYDSLSTNWAVFSAQQKIYDQIRFIDKSGNEVIRVNYADNISTIVPEDELQNKADRYYFYDSIDLPDGSIYMSPLDLNVEHGQVEIPYKPMIRLSAPVYSDDNELLGVVVLNYLAEQMLYNFREIASHSDGEMLLLNSSGYILSSSDKSQEWSFMFPDTINEAFAKHNLVEWTALLNGKKQLLSDKGLYTFAKVDVGQKISSDSRLDSKSIYLGGGNWYIVSYALRVDSDENHILFYDHPFELLKEVVVDNILILIALFIISVILGHLFFLYIRAYQKTLFYSKYDALTGAYNRRTGTEKLDEILLAKERKNFLLSLCFIDVNGLKEVNDVLGHKEGDELLKTVTTVINTQIREGDFIARMGGDEFLVVFSRIDGATAEKVWQRIVDALNKINTEEDRNYLISVSHGIVSCGAHNTCATTDTMIKAADEKMYDEKRVIKKSFYAIRDAEKNKKK